MPSKSEFTRYNTSKGKRSSTTSLAPIPKTKYCTLRSLTTLMLGTIQIFDHAPAHPYSTQCFIKIEILSMIVTERVIETAVDKVVVAAVSKVEAAVGKVEEVVESAVGKVEAVEEVVVAEVVEAAVVKEEAVEEVVEAEVVGVLETAMPSINS
jgi:hypothetical protein